MLFKKRKKKNKWIIGGEVQIIGNGNPVIKDIDLDQEVVIVDGERLTEARAEQISEEIMEAFYKYKGMKFVPRKLQN
ncbi:MAG: hypothetical protein JHD34_02085 [Candidatus Nanopelagicus sp.]|jgi:hypothetical protein|nr:hypothetical protein [Candidatus Nanopelagicus sp.]